MAEGTGSSQLNLLTRIHTVSGMFIVREGYDYVTSELRGKDKFLTVNKMLKARTSEDQAIFVRMTIDVYHIVAVEEGQES